MHESEWYDTPEHDMIRIATYSELSEIPETSEYSEEPLRHSDNSDYSDNSKHSDNSDDCVRDAANRCAPKDDRAVSRSLFKFARELRSLFPNALVSDLGPYVEVWHKVALEHVSGLDWTLVWWSFIEKWDAVKFPSGQDPLSLIVKSLDESKPPECASKYRGQVFRFVHILQRLQMTSGDKPIFMAERVAARLMNTTQSMARTCLQKLVKDGVLERVAEGTAYLATRYRYLGDL